ncbi:hypothetical protein RBH26_12840 [Natronolimnohabitans sp. A-GB9]|uniref:hypothetical protein n=1 Tax=Natronolimnohabitans sp. A-GB9 TaxID=3069757 RepID=UPI0027AE21A3|nr:hypothetical protein [Natronolimnohabitans sp. A-GB9]MDQ2051363.1 hypothetical protein [Natronolimnohabitans sp. A-GB9]
MKRALTVTFTTMVAVGLIFLMGFAGSAAAVVDTDNITVETGPGGDGGDGGNAVAEQGIAQENNNDQTAVAEASADANDGYDKHKHGSSATATAGVNQFQASEQSNFATQGNATAVAGDGGDGGDGGLVTVDADIGVDAL